MLLRGRLFDSPWLARRLHPLRRRWARTHSSAASSNSPTASSRRFGDIFADLSDAEVVRGAWA